MLLLLFSVLFWLLLELLLSELLLPSSLLLLLLDLLRTVRLAVLPALPGVGVLTLPVVILATAWLLLLVEVGLAEVIVLSATGLLPAVSKSVDADWRSVSNDSRY